MEYDIPRRGRRCAVSDRDFRGGEWVYSCLVPQTSGWKRVDIAADAWSEPPADTVGYWLYQAPNVVAPEKPVETDWLAEPVAWTWFVETESDSDRDVREDRYVLALELLQRKIVKLVDLASEGSLGVLVVKRNRAKDQYRVLDPRVAEEQWDSCKARLLQRLATRSQTEPS